MKTFAGIPKQYATFAEAEVILQSIPYDGTSTWKKGADKGFEAFLEAAENLELYDIETDSEVYKKGIYLENELKDFANPKQMVEKVYSKTKQLLKSNKLLTFFGGEHSISIGIIKAFNEVYNNLTVLQIDAHSDLRPKYLGSEFNHACAMHEASKNCNLIQVGIRSMDVSEKEWMDFNKVYFAKDIMDNDLWQMKSIGQISKNLYITVDLDVLDPAIMPSTGTPEPGGLSWFQLINYLKLVFKNCNVVGFDIVELAPIEKLHAPNFLAAKLYYKMLSYNYF